MTLTPNANDLKNAIARSYRTLQATLKALRCIGYYEGKLNLKHSALKTAARKVLAKLTKTVVNIEVPLKDASDTTQDQILFHQIFLNSAPVSDTARQWADSHEQGAIVMIHQPNSNGSNGYYMAYASHALMLGRVTDRPTVTENRVAQVSIPHRMIWHYQQQMRNRYGIEIVLLDPRQQDAA